MRPMKSLYGYCCVELTKKRFNEKTQQYERVRININRDIVEHKLATELNTLLNKQNVVEFEFAKKKLRMDKIVDLDGNELSLEHIISNHPLDFRLQGNRIMRAR